MGGVGTCGAAVHGRQRGAGVAGVVGVGRRLQGALRRAHLAQDGGSHLLPLRLQLLHRQRLLPCPGSTHPSRLACIFAQRKGGQNARDMSQGLNNSPSLPTPRGMRHEHQGCWCKMQALFRVTTQIKEGEDLKAP